MATPQNRTPQDISRHSSALDQFFLAMQNQIGLKVLDLGGVNQQNAAYFEQIRQTVTFDNFMRSMEDAFGDGDFHANQQKEECIELFQSEVLNHEEDSIDGILAWDSLQYLSPQLLEAAVDQLHAILHKGGQLLTIFHMDDKAPDVPVYAYRIQARNQLALLERSRRKPAQHFTTRSIEKLFHNFDSVKFFLTQDALREVIVRK